jgi:PAS domain-containing protein
VSHSSPPSFAAFDHLLVGTAVLRDDRIVYVNDACERLFELRREQLIGLLAAEMIQLLTPPEHHSWLANQKDAAVAGKGPSHLQVRLRSGTGELKLIHSFLSAGPGIDGKIERWRRHARSLPK